MRYRPLNMGTLGAPPTAEDVLAQQEPGSGIDGQAVEGGLAAAAGEPVAATPEPTQPEAPQVADVSLNGAQITGLIAIIAQVPAGLLTKDGAAAMIAASFPSISAAQVAAILAGVVENQPVPAAEPAQPPQAEPVIAAPAGRSEDYADASAIAEGDWVTFGDGRIGKVDHVMTEGVLNQGDLEVPASPEAPVMLVSVWADGDFAGQEPVMLADATVIEEPEDARGWKPKKPRRRKRGG